MNPNFYNQQQKKEEENKSLFGGQGNVFGGQGGGGVFGNKTGVGFQGSSTNPFGGQQQGTGVFGAGGVGGLGGNAGMFGGQRPPQQAEGSGMFGGQPSTTMFGKQDNQQATGTFGSPMFGGQGGAQGASGFGPQSTGAGAGMFGTAAGTQQVNNTFATTQAPGGMFGGQSTGPVVPTQPSNPFQAGGVQVQGQGGPVQTQGAGGSVGGASMFGGVEPQTGMFGSMQQQGAGGMGTMAAGGEGFGAGKEGVSEARMETKEEGSEVWKHGGVGQPCVEKNVSFVQMTLNEIIQQQTRKLEENMRVFKEKAQEVFEQDERIIRALNNYRVIRKRIEEEERIIAETEENVEFFEKWLDSFRQEVPDVGGDELATCIKELERVSDRYNKSMCGMKDEEDEVMCLVNENYNLIKMIDEKLDVLERY